MAPQSLGTVEVPPVAVWGLHDFLDYHGFVFRRRPHKEESRHHSKSVGGGRANVYSVVDLDETGALHSLLSLLGWPAG